MKKIFISSTGSCTGSINPCRLRRRKSRGDNSCSGKDRGSSRQDRSSGGFRECSRGNRDYLVGIPDLRR